MTSSAVLTYRYLRLSVVALAMLLATAVVLQAVDDGFLLSSISAYYYTPVRALFVGTLVAIGLALVVIKGRDRRGEDVLLNLAGLLAPVIAVVPTPIATHDGPAGRSSVPASYVPGVDNNIQALLVLGTVVVGVVAWSRTRRRGPRAGAGVGPNASTVAGLVSARSVAPRARSRGCSSWRPCCSPSSRSSGSSRRRSSGPMRNRPRRSETAPAGFDAHMTGADGLLTKTSQAHGARIKVSAHSAIGRGGKMAPAKHEHAQGPARRPSPEGLADAPPSSPGDDAEPASAPDDPRVAAVLEVLGGTPLSDVATTWSVDPTLLQRWTTPFVGAGTAQVLNRPEAQALAQRERFLAAFPFEIRTPLTVAMGWSGLLAEGDLPSRSFLRTARRLQETLALLADRLVDVELLVAAAMGGLQVSRRVVSAAEVCRFPEVDLIGGSGAGTELYVDPTLFTRVLADLWDAALHAPSPHSRRIEVVVNEPWAEIRIVREGGPIATETLQAMFEPFESDQLHSGVSTGLYLARALTVAHGGTLGIDQDDQRAVLWVKVPQRPDGAPRGAPVNEPAAAHNSGGSPDDVQACLR